MSAECRRRRTHSIKCKFSFLFFFYCIFRLSFAHWTHTKWIWRNCWAVKSVWTISYLHIGKGDPRKSKLWNQKMLWDWQSPTTGPDSHLSRGSKRAQSLMPSNIFRWLAVNHSPLRVKFRILIDPFVLQPGDHIEKLNGVNVVGKRHYEVARLLKDIATGSTFTLRLIEPMKSGFQGIGPRNGSKGSGKKGYGSGKETLRFKANGNASIEDEVSTFSVKTSSRKFWGELKIFISFRQHDETAQMGIDNINALLDSFMGINDTELATQVRLSIDGTSSRPKYLILTN